MPQTPLFPKEFLETLSCPKIRRRAAAICKLVAASYRAAASTLLAAVTKLRAVASKVLAVLHHSEATSAAVTVGQ